MSWACLCYPLLYYNTNIQTSDTPPPHLITATDMVCRRIFQVLVLHQFWPRPAHAMGTGLPCGRPIRQQGVRWGGRGPGPCLSEGQTMQVTAAGTRARSWRDRVRPDLHAYEETTIYLIKQQSQINIKREGDKKVLQKWTASITSYIKRNKNRGVEALLWKKRHFLNRD